MKKTLRGKRHIRARRSVQDGREKRQLHKFNRFSKALPELVKRMTVIISSDGFMNAMIDAMKKLATATSELRMSVQNDRNNQSMVG